jgi:hypothetical protein
MAEIDILSINNKKIQDVEARKDIQVIKENNTAIKQDINDIKASIGTEALTTTAKDLKGAVNEVSAQYKDIANLSLALGKDGLLYIKKQDGTLIGTGVKVNNDTDLSKVTMQINGNTLILLNNGTQIASVDLPNNMSATDVSNLIKKGVSETNYNALDTTDKRIIGGINEINIHLNSTAKKTIVEGNKIYLAKSDGTKLDTGTILPTGGTGKPYDDTSIKSDISNIKNDLGTAQLTTTAQNVKGAINEIDAKCDDIAVKTITTEERTKLTNLKNYDDTSIKTDINNIKTNLGTAQLTTTAKDVKGAINEVNKKIGTGVAYDDTAIKSDINTIKTNLGTDKLNTTAKDLKGAVNELNTQYKDIASRTITTEERNKLNSLNNYDDTSIKNDIQTINTQLGDIANKFTTEQTDNNFILKYGDKIIATIPINGTLVNYGSIVISCNEILEINEGETLDIEVYLSSKPTNNQSIVITTSNSNITTSVSELTFTPNNYATSQIITLTAIHDVSSFDDKNCLVTFASENVENITITVTIKNTDVQQSHYITDGLSLYYDFTETPTNPTTVYDKVNNVSIYNKNYTADNYTSNGVYLINGGGSEAYKFGSSSVSVFEYQTMPEFNNFLNKIKEGNGLTIEYFGQYIPVSIMYAYNSGVNASGTGAIGGGYLTKYESLGGVTFKYLNTSNETTSVSLAQSDKATKDGQSILAYSADNKADTYIHLVITADETGKLTWYLNGNVMSNTATATDFASWDYDTMFKANYCMLVRCGVEDTNRLIYPATSIKIYNRALIQDEIKTNLEYEISKTNFVNSASVTP